MTNEELARVLNTLDFLKTNNPLYRHEINVAIHAVNILPKVEVITDHAEDIAKALESQPCEDAISREAVVNWLEVCTDDSIEHAIESNLEFIPSVKSQPKIDEIIKQIEETRDKDKIAEYPYNRCIKIIREVLGDD